MKKIILFMQAIMISAAFSCNSNSGSQQQSAGQEAPKDYAQGTFGYDLSFLQKQDSVIVLKSADEKAQVIVSPKYQAKVFTSTAGGPDGKSFGWVNYKAFSGPADPHMNAFGGENRFWLGPEGGHYSLFFKPGKEMVFDNWVTPGPFDTAAWELKAHDDHSVTMHKDMQLLNYAGTQLNISVTRQVSLLGKSDIESGLRISLGDSVQAVAYRTDNTITNAGTQDWTEKTGMPCIWILDMFSPAPQTVIAVPYRNDSKNKKDIATTDYFGQIPPDRIHYEDNTILFKADGKQRGKLGVPPQHALPFAGSYDPQHQVLTILHFDLDTTAQYLNQEWNTKKPVFSGDAVNAYNDGPLQDGSQMGPFYEMESVSPAAMLKSGASQSHSQSVFHFTGPEKDLDAIAQKLLGISIDKIKQTFQ